MSQTHRIIEKNDLTIREAQNSQPWDQTYPSNTRSMIGYEQRDFNGCHALLHIQKAAAKIASIYERMDHEGGCPLDDEYKEIEKASADLMNIALRFANLYNFDLQTALENRVIEKNGRGFERE